MKTTLKPRVSRITIGRLYNLGNYEHIRYELSVDVPEGTKPSKAFIGAMRVLRAANPKPPCSAWELERARIAVAKDGKDRSEDEKANLKLYQERVAAHELWRKQREAALTLLDTMGGTKEHRDAKHDWTWGDEDY